ncbi:hypothetical protein Tco_0053308 [Tanacetum coccineum]
MDWLREGDSNSAYFHKAVKSRISRSRIDVVTCADGTTVDNEKVADAFVSHYEQFLGLPGITSPFDTTDMFSTRLTDDHARDIICVISRHEVKDALFFMGNDKSPGPDGYTAAFFKESWEIIADDFFDAVNEFFINGKLLKELNHMIIALIPKIRSPSRVMDYRPISCCNVLFKCISKIIANRIKESLKLLVSPNQSAFVSGRSIADNILLTQELMHNYHLDRGSSRCAFKVDIQKSYDTVDWGFLKEVLVGFGFHARMIGWIMECVTTTSFSISISGSLHGFFKGKRGLRQDVDSAIMIKDALEEFKNVSGLTPSLPKNWKNKSLSTAGRLQLIKSVIGSMHIYWASVFILPSRVLLDIEQLMRGFLWCQGELHKGRAKVAWEVVCLPKDEGGLGMRRLDIFKKALMVTHIWKLLSMKESLWERNNRLFMNNKRTIQQLIECIKTSIWLKLVSCCFKKSKSGVRLAQEWSLPDTCFR